MVKETILIENKKPIEIVCELKDEYPSYEEFMKTYESDGNLNYADLSGDDVGEVKGYGPCYKWCKDKNSQWYGVKSDCGCDCNRYYYPNDCDCRQDEKWSKLFISCPAAVCEDANKKDRTPSYWVHSIDDSKMWISNQARIRCEKSDCSNYHMSKWNFSCSAHKGEYRQAGLNSYRKALGLALQNADIGDVFDELVEWTINHKEEWNEE